MPQYQISYAADASFLTALPLLDYWHDTPQARELLRETMHPANFWPRIGDVTLGTGESDHDFFSRIAGPYNRANAQTWQEIAHRIGWVDGQPVMDGWLHATISPKYYLQNHYRAKVLAAFFSQPEIKAAHGPINWPAQSGINATSLQYERDFVAEIVKEEAKQDAKMPLGAYVALAMITFGVGQAVAVAVAAAAEATAAAAAAQAAATVGTEAAIAVGSEAITQVLVDIGLELTTKIATQNIMSLVTTGELIAPDPLKLAMAVADNLLPTDIQALADLDQDFPSVDVADVITLANVGWGVYQAYVAIEADPSIPLRASPPPPPPPGAVLVRSPPSRPTPVVSAPAPAPAREPPRSPAIVPPLDYAVPVDREYTFSDVPAGEIPDYFTVTGTAPDNAPKAIPWWAPVAAIALLILG